MKKSNLQSRFLRKKQSKFIDIQESKNQYQWSMPKPALLTFIATLFSVMFLYTQILQTVDGNISLTISIMRSIGLSEIPIVIFPYVSLLLISFMLMVAFPLWLGFGSLLGKAWEKFRGSKAVWLFSVIISFIYGIISYSILLVWLKFLSGLEFPVPKDSHEWKIFFSMSLYFSAPFFVFVFIFSFIIYKIGATDEYIVKFFVSLGWSRRFAANTTFYISCFLLFLVIFIIPQPVSDFTDTRSCVKIVEKAGLVDGVSGYQYISGYLIGESGSTVSVVATHIGLNPENNDDFQKSVGILYIEKSTIEFIKGERCGAYLDNLNKDDAHV